MQSGLAGSCNMTTRGTIFGRGQCYPKTVSIMSAEAFNDLALTANTDLCRRSRL